MRILVVFGLFMVACINAPPFVCTSDEQCISKSKKGLCVPAANRPSYCALPVDHCPSGFGYNEAAAPDLINTCAVLPMFEVTSSASTVKEHDVFSLHVKIKDHSGQIITSYQATPTVRSDWGEVRLFNQPPFVNGEADYTLWLSRATDPLSGLAHVQVSTTTAKGQSQEMTVTVPGWEPAGTVSLLPSSGPRSFAWLDLLSDASGYSLFAMLTESGVPASIYRATGSTIESLNLANSAFFTAASVPWSMAPKSVGYHRVIADGADLVMAFTGVGSGFLDVEHVGIAKSTAGGAWKVLQSAQIAVQSDLPNHLCEDIAFPKLVLESPGHYKMFYESFNSDEQVTCVAESSDGGVSWSQVKLLEWTPPEAAFYTISVFKEGSTYKAWDADNNYGTSADGIHWIRSPQQTSIRLDTVAWSEAQKKFIALVIKDKTNVQVFTRQ